MIDTNEWKARRAAQLEAAEAARRRTACEHVLERLMSELERAADAEATLHRAAYRRLGAAHRVRTAGGQSRKTARQPEGSEAVALHTCFSRTCTECEARANSPKLGK